MNEILLKGFVELIQKHGKSLWGSQEKCRQLKGRLLDLCGESRGEAHALVCAAEMGVPEDLQASGTAIEITLRLAHGTERLHQERGLDRALAEMAVRAWATALGLKVLPPPPPPPPPPVRPSVPSERPPAGPFAGAPVEAREAMLQRRARQLLRSGQLSSFGKQSYEDFRIRLGVQEQRAAAILQEAASEHHLTKEPPTLVVSLLGGGDCRTVSEAIRRAVIGTRILLRPGIYRESLVVDKPIEIIGEGRQQEVVLQTGQMPGLTLRCAKAVISGLTLQATEGGAPSAGAAIELTQPGLVLHDCCVTAGTAPAMVVRGAEANVEAGFCLFHSGKGRTLVFAEGSKGQLEDCVVRQDKASYSSDSIVHLEGWEVRKEGNAGLWVDGKSVVVAHRCGFCDCAGYGALLVDEGSGGFGECWFNDNENGIKVVARGRAKLVQCELARNDRFGAELGPGSCCTIYKSQVHDNTVGVFLDDPSGFTIEDSTITANRTAGAWCKAYRDQSTPFSRCCFTQNSVGLWIGKPARVKNVYGSTFDGNQVGIQVAGQARLGKVTLLRNGTGLTVSDSGRATCDECGIQASRGNGIQVESGLAILEKCTSQGNAGSGIEVGQAGVAVLRDSTLSGNGDAGASCEGGEGILHGCRISENRGPGVKTVSGLGFVLAQCQVAGNEDDNISTSPGGQAQDSDPARHATRRRLAEGGLWRSDLPIPRPEELLQAVESGDAPRVEILLKYGANPEGNYE